MATMNKSLEDAYVERDLSWMYFNYRILKEAGKEEAPLLERLNFLGIYSNNLDEFYRVRMATLNRIVQYDNKNARQEREKAKSLIKQISALNNKYSKEYEVLLENLIGQLAAENIVLLKENELNAEQTDFIQHYYRDNLSGYVCPIWLSSIKQLSDETDNNIYLAVRMLKQGKKNYDYALIALPVEECGRFVRLPNINSKSYIMYIDDIVRLCLPMIFAGLDYVSFQAYAFKLTKDAEMEIDNDLRISKLQKISKGVKSRKKGEALRVIYDNEMPKDLLRKIMTKLDLDKLDTLLGGGECHNNKDLVSFPDCDRKDLKYPKWTPVIKPELESLDSILGAIQKQDRFIHVPYHSFEYYIRVLHEAANNKHVKSIKTTLYRLAKSSKVVKALIAAARNGKKVTVVIELLARFDESSNISWSKQMQDAGINVIFGVDGLKVHSKITHIEMSVGNDIACISTGNFHEGNAKVYTDFMLMTSSRNIVDEVNKVFNFIEKPYIPTKFNELLVSPNEMKKKFISLINSEIKNKQMGKPAFIYVKINHITDSAIIKKLYEASANDVDVKLLVRGNCSIRTGINGISDTIHISGIIDRYLEHSRIFVFCAGGEHKTFIGSADWMPRNLDYRIEVVTPIYDKKIKAELMKIITFGLRDNTKAYIVDGSGKNLPSSGVGTDTDGEYANTVCTSPFRSQEELYKSYMPDLLQ